MRAYAPRRRRQAGGPRPGQGRPARSRRRRSIASRRCSSSRCASRSRIRAFRATTADRAALPAVTSVTIIGPHNADGARRHAEPPADLRRASPATPPQEAACAQQDPVDSWRGARIAARSTDDGRRGADGVLRRRRADGGGSMPASSWRFAALLVDPEFLFRVETDPAHRAEAAARPCSRADVYRISDLELASRLSFFLWSSIPDDELLDAGGAGHARRIRRCSSAGQADAGRPARRRR